MTEDIKDLPVAEGVGLRVGRTEGVGVVAEYHRSVTIN